MRGKGMNHELQLRHQRITPAYAGKRGAAWLLRDRGGDHPRVCGEKLGADQVAIIVVGSPPRMRGKVFWQNRAFLSFGITPAYAGKRGGHGFWRAGGRDHPRVCGEKSRFWLCCFCAAGSPPRMRGKGFEYVKQYGEAGITPAYAGKRTRRAVWTPCGWDHPRVCGEKTKKIP